MVSSIQFLHDVIGFDDVTFQVVGLFETLRISSKENIYSLGSKSATFIDA
jgi:hypothetical protein